jgi:hypothetical protein
LNLPCVLSTVCGMSSWLIQVTCVPGLTLMAPGVKAKLSIFTSVAESVDAPPEAIAAMSVPPPFPDIGELELSSGESMIARLVPLTR